MEQDLPIVLFEIKVIKLKLRAFYTLLDRFIINLITTDGYYSTLSLFSRPKTTQQHYRTLALSGTFKGLNKQFEFGR